MTAETAKRIRLAIAVVMAVCTALDGFLLTESPAVG